MMYTYTLYESPIDFPGMYVVRRFTIAKGGPVPDREPYLVDRNRATIEVEMSRLGLFKIPRSPEDDPCIVCTYI